MTQKDPQFTEEHGMFRAAFRMYVENELAPHVNDWEKAKIFPREVFNDMGKRGYLGMRYPVELGGSGLDYWFTVIRPSERRGPERGPNFRLSANGCGSALRASD